MKKDSRIFIAGGQGLVGSAIIRNLISRGYTNISASYRGRKPSEDELRSGKVGFFPIDLLDSAAVDSHFKAEKPEYVYLAAAKVGGIVANNTYRADFIYENLQIQNNMIYAAYRHGVKKLMFLGSSCIYPKDAPQPMNEDCLLTSPLEYTNEPYAISKIAGIKLCESFNIQYGTNFISVMPTNLYGYKDNFDLEKSHVLPALIRKFHLGMCLEKGDEAAIRNDFSKNPVEGVDGNSDYSEILGKMRKYGITASDGKVMVEIWGTGRPMREFMHADDMADACNYLMESVDFSDLSKGMKEVRNTHINIGTGKDISIADLADMIKEITGFGGDIYFNTDKPDGTMKKLQDVRKLSSLGWTASTGLDQGIRKVYENYINIMGK